MARHGRTKSDVRPSALQMSPTKSKIQDLRSPISPLTGSKSSRNRSMSIMSTAAPLKSPEEWIELALTKIWEFGRPAPAIEFLAAQDPDLLEFLMTANEDIWSTVHDSICGDLFPTTQAAWKDSLSSILLERFYLYLNRLPPNLTNRKVDETIRQVLAFVNVVGVLDYITFDIPTDHKDNNIQEEEDPFFTTKKSQKKRRNTARARQNTTVVDPRLFAAIDFDIPTSPGELTVTEICLFDRLNQLLKDLLQFFTDPKLAEHAKQLFFKQPLQYLPTKPAPSPNAEPVTNTTNASAPDPGAFPHIRPLGATKYFDDGVGLGAWPVIVSGRAVAHLRQMQKGDSHVFAMVREKITELSQGFFSNDNQKRLLGLETEVPIYEAKVSRDLHIVYQIDLDTDLEAKIDKQIIKLYGVYTHDQLDNRLWASVSQFYINRRGREYRRRCLYRTTHRTLGQNVTTPAHFPHEEDLELPLETTPAVAASVEGMSEKDFLDLHSLIALEKFIPMSQTLINSILSDSDASHVFHVSAKEKEIIYHQSACFVLGRSGTGKTTSILFKMIGIEKLFEQMKEVTKPRQVFVTQSRVLAQRVQEYYRNLVSAASSTSSHGAEQVQDEEHVLADLDDEDASAFGLPPKYSMLEEKHFPLFLTYDQLCGLIEADFGLQFRRSIRTKAHAAAEQRFAIQEIADVKIDLDQEDDLERPSGGEISPVDTKEDVLHARRAAVTFDIFIAAYWPHFDYRLTKGLDPALVYSEFLGVIEGSEFALEAKNGALSREDYSSISHRKASFASQRDRVYDLYEIYRKRKRELGGYDAAERRVTLEFTGQPYLTTPQFNRTHALINAMNEGIPGEKIDCLYVDEAQDNLLIDVKLLHKLSNNPHGIFMAGDTAQTISAGSSFRFEDLKAFMWRLEEQDKAVRCGKRNAIHPALFHLAVNYRSHGGIVDCASSVVQLISELFPHSIDRLNKESGLIDGPKPIFFSGWDRGVVRFEQFLRGETDTKIDFGASQVILVRNDSARDSLRAQVGEIGLILTLYESKGLEFDDVLLYNFFEDSVPTASTWRVILHGLQGVNVGPIPRFDEIRHAVICAELKNLYVGLTRARNHCWIWEESEKGEPMKMFWNKQNLITLCGPNDPMPQLSVSSSEADWAKSGRLLFNKGLYPQAMFCFEKADLPLERDIAGAYQSRKEARLLLARSVDRQTSRAAFYKTGKDFLGCAILSKGKQQTSCYLRAAECFMQAEDWKLAAEAFFSANEFDRSAKNFRRAGCFSEAVDVIKKHGDKIKKGIVEDIVAIARLEFLRTSQYQQATELFDDVEEQLEYMEDFGFDLARVHVLELHQRFSDAADVALRDGDTLECVRLLLRSSDPDHIHQAIGHALHGLWSLLPYASPNGATNHSNVMSLLSQISIVEPNILDEQKRRQIELFRVLQENKQDRMIALAKANALLSRTSEALLCFARCSRQLTMLQNSTVPDLIGKSGLFLSYCNGLQKLVRDFQPFDPDTQLLLGFGPVRDHNTTDTGEANPADTEFRIYSSSFMFETAKDTPAGTEPTPYALGLTAVSASESSLRHTAIRSLSVQINHEVRKMHTAAVAVWYLRPCLDFGIFGNCNRPDCGRQEISSILLSDSDRQKYFNARLRAHVLHVLIAQTYSPQDSQGEHERQNIKRIWTHKIYETLFPHFPPLGNFLCVDPKQVPELNRASDVLSRWCENRLHELNPFGATPRFFLSEVLLSLELAYRVQREVLHGYVAKLHHRALTRPRPELSTLGSSSSMIHSFIDFYGEKTEHTLRGVLDAVQSIFTKSLPIEVNVLVHLLESVGREIIMQARTWTLGGEAIIRQSQEWVSARSKALDGLFLPRSWALDIVQRPPTKVQLNWETQSYFNILFQLLVSLRYDNPELSPLYTLNGQLGTLLRGILIVRVCRLLILVCHNLGEINYVKNTIRQSITRSLTGKGPVHNSLCSRFARAESWKDLEFALVSGPLNRGADELVQLSSRSGRNRPRDMYRVRPITYETIKPDLENQLSFVDLQDHGHGPNLNPEAKPFAPASQMAAANNQAEQSQSINNEKTEDEKNKTADVFEGLVPSQLSFRAPAPAHIPQRSLSNLDILAGTRILLCYRRYNIRQRLQARRAVRIIWAYYTRYHRRNRILSGGSEDAVRNFHQEYKRDVDSIDCPLLLAKMFRHHEMVLQGPMPHVLVYLRGLERINQRQKDSTKKRLQKVQHEELEKVQDKMTTCSTLARRFRELYPKVQPGSDALHRISSLKERVHEVDELRKAIIGAFGEDCISAELETHYFLGVRVILAPAHEPTATKPLRPELNVEDLRDVL